MENDIEKPLTLYGTPICPMLPPVRNLLKRANVDFTYVDISRDAEAKALVREINNGNESVPTLVFNDGQTLTEPSHQQLKTVLEQRGYTIAEQTVSGRVAVWLQNPALLIAGASLLGFGLLRGDMFMIVAGVVLVLARFIVRKDQ